MTPSKLELTSQLRKRKALPLEVALLLLILAAPVLAQSGGPYDLSWFTVDGGGGTSSGGGYALSGTAGQPDAGVVLTGGDYILAGGFWSSGALPPEEERSIYLPLVLRVHNPS